MLSDNIFSDNYSQEVLKKIMLYTYYQYFYKIKTFSVTIALQTFSGLESVWIIFSMVWKKIVF